MGENLLERDKKGDKISDCGGGMRKRLSKLGTDWRGIMAKEEREMIQEMKSLITIDMEQTIEEGWARVERSKYCPYFKRLMTDLIMESYWTDKGEKKKERWARARCGNIK